jgi:hypothetical protein
MAQGGDRSESADPGVAQISLVLFFVRATDGWRNWSLRNAPPDVALGDFLRHRLRTPAMDETRLDGRCCGIHSEAVQSPMP